MLQFNSKPNRKKVHRIFFLNLQQKKRSSQRKISFDFASDGWKCAVRQVWVYVCVCVCYVKGTVLAQFDVPQLSQAKNKEVAGITKKP